jgi:hypothetical protein
LWETREERSGRCRCAAVRFDAAHEPLELLGEVACRDPAETSVVVPGFLAQSTHLEPEAVCETEEAAGLSLLPEQLTALEVGDGDVEMAPPVGPEYHFSSYLE